MLAGQFEQYKQQTDTQIAELKNAVFQQHETIAFLLDAIQDITREKSNMGRYSP